VISEKCPYCGATIDREKARTNCTNCAHALAPTAKRKASRGSCLVMLAAMFGIAIVAMLLRPNSSSRGGSYEATAVVTCENFVRNRLKAPGTAKFPWAPDTHPTKGDGTYRVSGWVDAQNAFGTTLRSDWVCTVEQVGERWKLIDLELTPR
jgi:hypothetical protein